MPLDDSDDEEIVRAAKFTSPIQNIRRSSINLGEQQAKITPDVRDGARGRNSYFSTSRMVANAAVITSDLAKTLTSENSVTAERLPLEALIAPAKSAQTFKAVKFSPKLSLPNDTVVSAESLDEDLADVPSATADDVSFGEKSLDSKVVELATNESVDNMHTSNIPADDAYDDYSTHSADNYNNDDDDATPEELNDVDVAVTASESLIELPTPASSPLADKQQPPSLSSRKVSFGADERSSTDRKSQSEAGVKLSTPKKVVFIIKKLA